MRYPASEKLEIIRIVERSHLPAKQTLDKLGIARPTFYRWYDLYQRFGEEALEDGRPGPRRAWNRIPDKVQAQILDMALERSELSPRELAVTFTDEQRYFVSEASVYYSRTARTPGSDANVQQAQLARLAGSKRVNDYFTLVISTGRRNTLIFVGKMECWNELQTTDIFYRCAEVGDLGSLTARRVDEFDWP